MGRALEDNSDCSGRLFRRSRETPKKTTGRFGGCMDYDSCRSLPAMFFEQADRLGESPSCGPSGRAAIGRVTWAGRRARCPPPCARPPIAWNRPRRAGRVGLGESAGMDNRRSRDHERRERSPFRPTSTHRSKTIVTSSPTAGRVRYRLEAGPVGAGSRRGEPGGCVHTVIAIEPATDKRARSIYLSWDEILARGAEPRTIPSNSSRRSSRTTSPA